MITSMYGVQCSKSNKKNIPKPNNLFSKIEKLSILKLVNYLIFHSRDVWKVSYDYNNYAN
jgi:hypothetical protein